MPSDSTPEDSPASPLTAAPADPTDVADSTGATDVTDQGDIIGDAQDAIEQARRRLADAPAEVVITNHVMGIYELAAIHLSSAPPNLASAALAIDAVACLIDGLGDRLGADAATLRDALANIRLAFVQIKSASQTPTDSPGG